MSNLKNKVQLIGFIGKDPEVRTLESGKCMVRFSVATSETYKNAKGEKVKDTQWHNIVAWGATAEFISKYFKKGSEIALEGKLSNRSYQDKDGKTVYTTEVVAEEVTFMTSGKENKKVA